jgi:hypothetical protein
MLTNWKHLGWFLVPNKMLPIGQHDSRSFDYQLLK